MSFTSTSQEDHLLPEIGLFTDLLQYQGVHAALEYLNHRTPHRYTGLFRFDEEMLRNEALFDRHQPSVRQGLDVPMAVAYCALVGRQEAPVTILDAALDPLAQGVDTPVACLSATSRGRRMVPSATMICSVVRSVPYACPY
jgi:hypothetical protein